MKITSTLVLCALTAHCFAQSEPQKIKYRKTMPVHLELAAGTNNSRFIDFGTSPLYYSGLLYTFSGTIRKETDRREVYLAGLYSSGNYSMDYNDIKTTSTALANISLRYSRLYRLNVFNNDKWNLKVGGAFDVAGMLRTNTSLFNNSLGYNVFTNLFASGKISRDISNTEPRKLWFFRIKPKNRKLYYQLDLGVVNGAFSNGFIYTNSTPVYNDASLSGGYTYKLFSGYRMGSRLDYQFDIFNRNTLKVSYIWDAMMTGKQDQDRFQLANKMLLLSLNIKLR